MPRTYISVAKVLSEMVLSGVTTRRDLYAKLGVSKATMTLVANKLLNQNVIEENTQLNEDRRGRRTILLTPKEDLVYFLGTNMEGLAIRACLINHEKKIISSVKRNVGPNWSSVKILEQWGEIIDEVLKDSGVELKKIAAIGVGLPGKVQSRNHLQTSALLPPGVWVDLDTKHVFKKFDIATAAMNNVFCTAAYEQKLGAARDANNFIAVVIRYGSGIVVFANGAFLAGEQCLIGELGHMRMGADGPRCICGQKGCLDVYISGRTWSETNIATDASLKKELKKRAQFLAIGLANVLKIFHPDMVTIDGIYNEYKHEFEPSLLTSLTQELEGLRLPVPKVVFGNTVEFKASIGAALLAADEFLEQYFEKMLSSKNQSSLIGVNT